MFDEIEIREIDVIKYLDDAGHKYSRGGDKNTTHGWINVRCPFPDCDDDTNHLGVNLKTKLFSCWKCDTTGSILTLIKALEKCDWVRVFQIAKKYSDPNAVIVVDDIEFAKKVKFPPGITDQFLPQHLNFLRKRGYNARNLIKKYHLKAGGPAGQYPMRIIIPFYLDGKIVTFTSRAISNNVEQPYKNLALTKSIIDPRRIFYNIDNIQNNKVMLVEGCTDVWRIGDGAISSSGVKITQFQLQFLAALGIKHLFFVFDGGKTERTAARKFANFCSGYISTVEIIELDNGVDPNDLDKDDIEDLRRMLK